LGEGSSLGRSAGAQSLRAWEGPAGGVGMLILGTFLIRAVAGQLIGLGIDESYMVAAGRDLRLGYYDHPPAAWWLAWSARHLMGADAALIVRLPFIALFGVSTWLMYRLAAALYTPSAGLWAAVSLNLAPVFGVTTGSWVLPDGPLICALLGAALCLVHALPARGRTALLWWLGAGLCAGLALFAKYSALLILAGAFLYLLTQPQDRRWLRRPEPYLGAALALLVFAPVLAWNAAHDWASFAFQGGRASATRFRPLAPLGTLAGEALFLLPWIWLPLIVCFVAGMRRGPAARREWLLCCLAAFPIVLFALASVWSQRKMLFHWAAPGYLLLFPMLGAGVANRMARGDRATRIWLIASALLVCGGVTVVATEVRYNWLERFAGEFPIGSDPGMEVVDWTPLRTELAERQLLQRPGTVIAALNWRDAGKLGYALGDAADVICLNPDSRQFGFQHPTSDAIGQDVLIVAPRQTGAKIEASFGGLFASLEPLAPAMIPRAGGSALEVPLFIGRTLRAWPPVAAER
jgi:4-amino-4-deoxy-L-arabinose transferase-like glycosyltransferase